MTLNIFEKAKQFAEGAEAISSWLGSGGQIVAQEVSQARANTCLECSKNVPVGVLKDSIAGAAKKILEVKNKLGIRVNGERGLGQCQDCGCVLRLLVHEPQSRIEPFLTPEDRAKLPTFCWKLKKTE